MAAPNHKGFSAPAASWQELTSSLVMPNEFSAFFAEQPASVAPSLVQGAPAASVASSAPEMPSGGVLAAPIVASQGGASRPRKKKKVTNNPPPGDAPDDEHFAPPPVVTTVARRAKKGRRPTTCSNCGKTGHTKKKCSEPKRKGQLNAISVRDLSPTARRRDPEEPSNAAPWRDVAQDSDASSESEDEVIHQIAEEAAEVDQDAQCKYTDTTWTRHIVQDVPIPIATRVRSPTKSGPLVDDAFVGAKPFKLADATSHAKNIPVGCETEEDFVRLLLDADDDSIMDIFVHFTNAVARESRRLRAQKRFQKWVDVDKAEMAVFFAIVAYLGIVKIQNRKAVWYTNSIFHQPWISRRMSLKRFECIIAALNAANSHRMSNAEFLELNDHNPFWQVCALVDICNTNCARYWHMGRLMSLDEAVIPFKGRHRARCYNKAKPAKYHLKKFGLTCAKTGYNYAHYFYQGKSETRPANVPATAWPIITLLDVCPELHQHNRVLAVDNWFTSCTALVECCRRGVEMVGTMRPSRLSLESSKNGTFPLVGVLRDAKANRGDYVCFKTQTSVGTFICDHYVTTWQDKEPISILSTYPPYKGTCLRKVLEDEGWTEQGFVRPSVFSDYNSAMGGTDLHDQRLALVRSTVKSRRWQVKARYPCFYF
jgi:Transposase IS4